MGRRLYPPLDRGLASSALLVWFTVCGLSLTAPGCGSGEGGGPGGSGGQSGAAGTAGRGGTTGSAGSGVGGAAGSGGTAGATGAAGTTGNAGTSGTAGAGGAAGTTGAAGGAGTGGASGAAGSAGGGRGGSAGSTGGAGGAGGRGGAAGSAAGGRGGASGGSAGSTAGAGGNAPDGGSPDGARDGGGDGGTAYMPCPTTAGTACAVMPLGDSITEGYIPSGANGGYRVELFRQAGLGGKNITFVGTAPQNGPTTVDGKTFPRKHEGHGGYTIAGGGQGALAGTVTDSAIASQHPHIVLLMIGTNDINGNITISSAPTRLGQLIDEITTDAPTALVVVASIIPIANSGTNARVQTYNAAIPALVSTRAAAGKHVLYLDNYAAFAANPNYATALMADSLHPNEAGYAVLGRAFYGAISAVLP